MNKRITKRGFDAKSIKLAARGHWIEIVFALTGVPTETFDGAGRPCPKCAGKDRFSSFKDFKETGGVLCRHCHNGDTNPKSGDGIATVQWLTGASFPETLRLIAEQLGIAPASSISDGRDILGDLCKQKCMPIESAKVYGAEISFRGKQRVVRFPVYDAKGNRTSHSDVSPYAQGKLNKGMLPKGGKSGLHLPGRLPASGETWLIVEGVKDAAALHGMGFRAAGLTGSTMKKEFAHLFIGCSVVLIPDLDHVSFRGFAKTGAAIEKVVEKLSVARLPGEVKPTKGDDVRDVIARDGEDAVRRSIQSAEEFRMDDLSGNRPSVQIAVEDDTEQQVANKVIRILASHSSSNDNRIFQRAGKLVVVVDSDAGPRIVPLDETGIRERITAAVDLIERREQHGEESETLKRPPSWLCKAINSRPQYPRHVRRLDGIVTAPTIRPDGSILQTPGYDSLTCLLYIPNADYPKVPDNPTVEDAAQAKDNLLEIVSDFPFDGESAKSVWIALILTLVGRAAIKGSVPLFGFNANIRGSGKSKLCDIAGLIVHGSKMARKTLPNSDEETRKVITAFAIEARPVVLFDNTVRLVGGASLDAVLTSETWNDRILGKSETTGDLPWNTVLIVTGNNLAFQSDTARRVVQCNLDCKHENPEDRDDFLHANIDQYTKENRERLVVSALTILRAFFVSDQPYSGKRLGSFEPWSQLICGSVVFAGLPNPLDTVLVVREQDNTGAIFRMLLDGIEIAGGVDGLTSREILDGTVTEPIEGCDGWELIRTAIAEVTDKPSPRKIGGMLKRFQNRVSAGRRLIKKKARANLTRWVVEKLETADETPTIGSCNECGTTLTPTPTSDDRHCERCGKEFPCIPAAT